MAGRRIIPGRDILAHWVEEGLSQQEMVDRVYDLTGEHVTRQAISMALQRHNLTAETRVRYKDELPWTVAEQHAQAYPARMLRLLGRSRRGEHLSAEDTRRLTNWLAELREKDLVVGYNPEYEGGFAYCDRHPSDSIMPPIRRQLMRFARV